MSDSWQECAIVKLRSRILPKDISFNFLRRQWKYKKLHPVSVGHQQGLDLNFIRGPEVNSGLTHDSQLCVTSI